MLVEAMQNNCPKSNITETQAIHSEEGRAWAMFFFAADLGRGQAWAAKNGPAKTWFVDCIDSVWLYVIYIDL